MMRARLAAAVAVFALLLLLGGVLTAASGATEITFDTDELPTVPSTLALPPPTLGALPAIPSGPAAPSGGLPASPVPAPGGGTPPVLPGTGGAGPALADPDPCAQASGPAADGGAPAVASCPVHRTSDGGVDMPLCIDIAVDATCATAQGVDGSATTTTIASSGGPTDSAGGNTGSNAGNDSTGNGDGAPGADASAISPSTDTRGTGGTLPFTGGAIVGLVTIGTALAATGGALARVARRRAA
jgi:hypothetical protein